MPDEQMTGRRLAGEIYDLVNRLNNLVEMAARNHGFTIQWDVLDISTSISTYPHLDMTVLISVLPASDEC